MESLKNFRNLLKGSEGFDEPDLFKSPLSSSRVFKTNSIEMVLAACLGVYVLAQWWAVLPSIVTFAVSLALFIISGTWFRTLIDHRKVRTSSASWSSDQATANGWKLATQQLHAGLYSTNSVALLLLLAIMMILAHYEKPPWMQRLQPYSRETHAATPQPRDPRDPREAGRPLILLPVETPAPNWRVPAESDDHSSSPLRVDAQVMAAKLKHRVQPVYPKEAKIKGVEGIVKLHTIVARDGTVGDVKVISGPKELVQAAVDAVRQWQYEPTVWKGNPVEVDTTIDIIFKLKAK